jgi:hypothetical protein
MRQDRHGFSLTMFLLQAGQNFLTSRMIPPAEDGGFRERPREMGMADVRPRRPGAFSGGCLGTRHQTTIRRDILPSREAVALMDLIEQHKAEDLADAGHRVQQIQGIGIMVLGGVDEGEFHVAQQFIVRPDERKIDVDAFVHRWIGTALGDPVSVGFVGDLFADGREMILAVGVLSMGEEFAACACQVHASPQQVADGAHLGRIARGLGEHPAAPEHGNFMGVYLVVFGLAAMDGLHVEGMTEDKRDPLFGTEVRKPGPRSTGIRPP